LENNHKELGEQKGKFQSQGQSSSNTRPRYSFPQNPLFLLWRTKWKISSKHAAAALVSAAPTLQPTNSPHSKLPAKRPSSYSRRTCEEHKSPVQPNGCFKCGELGHYANNCPYSFTDKLVFWMQTLRGVESIGSRLLGRASFWVPRLFLGLLTNNLVYPSLP
jgi:hypothetical protein